MTRREGVGFVSIAVLLALSTARTAAQEVTYEKYRLDNGLTVILHEDHSLPVVAVNTWFRVGSKDEREHRSGFAHLFEHLMFMGTERVPNGDFDEIMESGGGSNNASTELDRTNYFSSGPAALLPTLLWLDADRLEDLGRMMDQEKLDRQREIVRNERRQSYENQPYGRVELLIPELMYPPGHPYRIPVIGTHADLEAATVADVKDFFANFYVPNNASLCIAGDFDSAAVKALLADLYGTLPRAAAPLRRTAEAVKLDGVKRATILDKVQWPMVAMAYHSPARFAPGEAEVQLVAAVLAEGKSSRLYKRLVYDERIAVDVSADAEPGQLGSLLRVAVMANTNADLDRIEATVDEEIARLCAEGPTPAELEQRKATVELTMLSGLQSAEALADRLNEYEYYLGEPNSFRRDLERYRAATVAGVQQWARTVLTPEARAIVRVLPEEPERPESPRDHRPKNLAPTAFAPPAPTCFKLSNGIPVQLWHKPALPLVGVDLMFSPGGTLDDTGQAGLASLTAAMLDEGAGDLDALQFGDALRTLGATLQADADHETLEVSLTVLRRNVERATALMADAVRRPRFAPADWDRTQRLRIEALLQEEEEPESVAGRVAARLLFGTEQAYGWPVDGTPATVAKLSAADARATHARFVHPAYATLLVAGDITAAEAQTALEQAFGDWKAEPPAARTVSPQPAPQRTQPTVVIVDRPEAVQTVLCYVLPGPRYADNRRVQFRLLNALLGGSFTSRLMQNLREEHGYTYGVHSGFMMEPTTGYFAVTSSVQTAVTGAAVGELLAELKRLRGGDVSDEEAHKAQATLQTELIQSFSGLDGILDVASTPVAARLPFETVTQDFRALPTIGADVLNSLATDALPLEQAVLVLVGDESSIREQLEPLGITPESEPETGAEEDRTD